jgi:adenylate cyclase
MNTVVERWTGDAQATDLMTCASEQAYWGTPVHGRPVGTVLNLRRPLFGHAAFLGIVVAAVRVAELSAFLAALETEFGQNAFILYDRDYLLAHRALEFEFPGLGPARPLPKVGEVADPVLFDIWQDGWEDRG